MDHKFYVLSEEIYRAERLLKSGMIPQANIEEVKQHIKNLRRERDEETEE
jgi:uncharacterized circularly permuted ATP-grasp superfamily protein